MSILLERILRHGDFPGNTPMRRGGAVGLSREDTHQAVQRNAMQVWEAGKDFQTLLEEDAEIAKHLSGAEIDDMFDMGYHTKQVDFIFDRVFAG